MSSKDLFIEQCRPVSTTAAKVSIVGAGRVGMATAFAMLMKVQVHFQTGESHPKRLYIKGKGKTPSAKRDLAWFHGKLGSNQKSEEISPLPLPTMRKQANLVTLTR